MITHARDKSPFEAKSDRMALVEQAFSTMREVSVDLSPQIKNCMLDIMRQAAPAYTSNLGVLPFDYFCLSLAESLPREYAPDSSEFTISRSGIKLDIDGQETLVPFKVELANLILQQTAPWTTTPEYLMQTSKAVLMSLKNEAIKNALSEERRRRPNPSDLSSTSLFAEPKGAAAVSLPELPTSLVEIETGENIGAILKSLLAGLKDPDSLPVDQAQNVLFGEDGIFLMREGEESPLFFEYQSGFAEAVGRSIKHFKRHNPKPPALGDGKQLSDFHRGFFPLLQEAIEEASELIPETRLPLVEIRSREIEEEFGIRVTIKHVTPEGNTVRMHTLSLDDLDVLEVVLRAGKDTAARAISKICKFPEAAAGSIDDSTAVADTYARLSRNVTDPRDHGALSDEINYQPRSSELRALSLSFREIGTLVLFTICRERFNHLGYHDKLAYYGICKDSVDPQLPRYSAFGLSQDVVRLGLAAIDFASSALEYQSAIHHNRPPNLSRARVGFLRRIFGSPERTEQIRPRTPSLPESQ